MLHELQPNFTTSYIRHKNAYNPYIDSKNERTGCMQEV